MCLPWLCGTIIWSKEKRRNTIESIYSLGKNFPLWIFPCWAPGAQGSPRGIQSWDATVLFLHSKQAPCLCPTTAFHVFRLGALSKLSVISSLATSVQVRVNPSFTGSGDLLSNCISCYLFFAVWSSPSLQGTFSERPVFIRLELLRGWFAWKHSRQPREHEWPFQREDNRSGVNLVFRQVVSPASGAGRVTCFQASFANLGIISICSCLTFTNSEQKSQWKVEV